MARAIADNRKKKGRPRIGSTLVGVRLPPDQLAALDKFIAKHPEPRPSRPKAIRRMVAEHLSGVRLLPTRQDKRNPKDAEPKASASLYAPGEPEPARARASDIGTKSRSRRAPEMKTKPQ